MELNVTEKMFKASVFELWVNVLFERALLNDEWREGGMLCDCLGSKFLFE